MRYYHIGTYNFLMHQARAFRLKFYGKADMKSYIPMETAAIFFLANLFLKQGIG